MLGDAMCGPYNRKGLLCGECIDGYGPAVYSYDLKCANCTVLPPEYAMGVFLFLELVPGTVFFLCLVFLHLNITSGPLLGYVLFCQLYAYTFQEDTYVYEYIVSDTLWPLRVLFYISLFWNLRFFKPVIPSFTRAQSLQQFPSNDRREEEQRAMALRCILLIVCMGALFSLSWAALNEG